jgi:uncharacterized protein
VSNGVPCYKCARIKDPGALLLDWSFLSSSAFFERTGKFRLGADELLIGANGESKISMEDFAIALVDELENPKHSRQRFTIRY